jgi:predicted short-subunit dehydrogenase-like oxidoreductase (DUF2520 family)
MKIGIIGAGRVGGALAIALSSKFRVCIASRHKFSAEQIASISNAQAVTIDEAARCDVVFLTVPDNVIKYIAEQISSFVKSNQVILHTSGALSSEIISFLDANVGSLHPLKSFADAESAAKTIKGTIFTFEGNEIAEKKARIIVDALSGTFVKIKPEDKVLYHLAAVLTANYTVTLFSLSQDILKSIGFSENAAKKSLLALLKGVVENIEEKGTDDALTGPILRGDSETVRMHLSAIKDKELSDIYILLGFATLKIAERRGLSKEKIDSIRKVLNEQNYRSKN